MFVEDEPVYRRLFRDQARRRGYQVDEFTFAELALQKLSQPTYREPDVVICGLYMPPGIDGRDFARELRLRGFTMPFIMSTPKIVDFFSSDIAEIESDGVDLVTGRPDSEAEFNGLLEDATRLVLAKRENPILQSP